MTTDETTHGQEMLSDTPIPPGEMIDEEIEYIGMTRQELSGKTGISPKVIDEIINGETPITQDIAVALERTLGFSATLLVKLEGRYQRTLARNRERDKATAGH